MFVNPLVNLKGVQAGGWAAGAFNVYNLESAGTFGLDMLRESRA